MDQLSAINASIEQLVAQLQHEGILDDQFVQLMQLQDESNPEFVTELVELYFSDSTSKLELANAILSSPNINYLELDQLVHQFKGSSASLGASMIANLCVRIREACQHQNLAECRSILVQIRDAFSLLKQRLMVFMQLDAQKRQLMAEIA